MNRVEKYLVGLFLATVTCLAAVLCYGCVMIVTRHS